MMGEPPSSVGAVHDNPMLPEEPPERARLVGAAGAASLVG